MFVLVWLGADAQAIAQVTRESLPQAQPPTSLTGRGQADSVPLAADTSALAPALAVALALAEAWCSLLVAPTQSASTATRNAQQHTQLKALESPRTSNALQAYPTQTVPTATRNAQRHTQQARCPPGMYAVC